MARKALLTENEIRRFLKLARLDTVNDKRLREISLNDPPEEEEEALGVDAGTDLDALDALGDEEELGADLEGDLEGDLEAGGGELDAELEDMLAQGVEALAVAWGIEDRVDVEGGEGGEEALEEPPLPGDEEEVELGMDIDAGAEEVALDAEEELPGNRMYEEEDLVQEVARRVVARLAANQKKSALSDQLAEKILKRLTSK
jgi:hypothetical protein